MMLILMWTVALVAALLMYCYNPLSKFHKRGVKAYGLLSNFKATLKVFMGRKHSSEIVKESYFDFIEERFIGCYIFGILSVQVHDLDLIKKITVKDYEHFLDHRSVAAGDPLFSRNLVSLKGEEWKDMRSNLSPAFTSSKIRHMVPFMVDVGDQMVLSLKKEIQESSSGWIEVNVKDLTSRYTTDVIASCAFGLKVDSNGDRDNEFYTRGVEMITFQPRQILFFIVWATFPWLTKVLKLRIISEQTHKFFMNLVLSNIENREKHGIHRPDMINLLMEAKKGKLQYDEHGPEADAGFATVQESVVGKRKIKKELDDIDMVAQALIFFLAGFDTVSIAMCFLLYELAVNPDVQDRLVEEIKEMDAKNEGKFDYNSIQQMAYLDMVVTETLRKWPVVPVLDRLCVKDYNMGKPNDKATQDYIIRKGEGIQIPMWAIHRDPKYFPDPLKFNPERFSEANKKKVKPFTYMPFGLGPRNCIGSRFALCEVKAMAYQLLQHLEVSPGPRTTITSELDPSKLTVVIKGGHWVRFKVRT